MVAWLHENYPAFHSTTEVSFESLEWISDQIGWTDAKLSGSMNWRLGLTPAADRNSSLPSTAACMAGSHYAAMAVARAIALCPPLLTKTTGSRFRPLKAPQSKTIEVRGRDSLKALRDFCESSVANAHRTRELLIGGLRSSLLDRLSLELRLRGSQLSSMFIHNA